ncbi:hypothetical protein ACNHYB_12765 [Isoptericola jiangsuensis]|uniref:hypothetical protein n=1 Tax=Isoptericola jiangsuensis TaxID=548579 RepID=UPI003AAF1F66
MSKLIRTALVGVGLGASVASIAGCSPASSGDEVVYHASYPVYSSVEDLESSSDLIVIGTPISSEVRQIDVAAEAPVPGDSELDPGSGDVEGEELSSLLTYTVYEVEVDQVLQGDARRGETVEVAILGGTMGGVTYREAEGIDPLALNEDAAFYLAAFEGAPYQPLNSAQSIYAKSSDSTFTSVGVENPISRDVAASLRAVTE